MTIPFPGPRPVRGPSIWSDPMRISALLVLALLLAAAPAPAQDASPLPPEVARRITAVLNAPGTDRRSGDAEVAAGQSVAGSLAVVDGDLELSGRVEGDVVVVNGRLEVESGAEVAGEVIVVGGDAEVSPGARMAGRVVAYPEPVAYCRIGTHIDLDPAGCTAAPAADTGSVALQAEPEDDVGALLEPDLEEASGRTSFVVAAGRSYNRVEGLPIRFGPSLETAGRNPTRLRALAVFRTEEGPELGPERWGFDARLEQFFGGRRALRVGGRLYSLIEPIEDWHLSDVENSLATFFLHQDYRDHYERQGWSAYATWQPMRSPFSATVEYRQERHRAAAPGSPWTLSQNQDAWRPQPLAARGHVEVVEARGRLDTRSEQLDPSTGWYVSAGVERALHSRLRRPTATPGPAPAPELPEIAYPGGWITGMVDVRRYNRISPSSRLNLRATGAASLNGWGLPPQRQHALGGEGSLPGFALYELDCQARAGTVTRGGETWYPQYGCDSFALFQVEWRGDLVSGLSWSDLGLGGRRADDEDDGGWTDAGIFSGDLGWVVFADMGAGWSDRGEERTAVDIGAGLTFGQFGVYAAMPVDEEDGRGGLNIFVRLAPRF